MNGFLILLRSLVVVGMFANPFAVSFSAVMKVVGFLTLLTSAWRRHWREVAAWPVTCWVLIVLAWMLLNMIGSAASPHYRWKIFLHYASFLCLMIMAAPLFTQQIWRRLLISSLKYSAVLMACILAVIDSSWQQLLSAHAPKLFSYMLHVIGAHTQETSVLLAIGCYLAILHAIFALTDCSSQQANQDDAATHQTAITSTSQQYLTWSKSWVPKQWVKLCWQLILLIFIARVLINGQGERVGVVVLVCLLLVLPFQLFSLKRALCWLLAAVLLLGGLSMLSGVQEKVRRSYNDYQAYQTDGAKGSIGERLSEARVGWHQWLQKPWRGYGTGTFTGGPELPALSKNNENNYIIFLQQYGLIGALLWILMLLAMWRQLQLSPFIEKTVGRGVLFAIVLAAHSFPAFVVNNCITWMSVVLAACYGANLNPLLVLGRDKSLTTK